MAQNLPGKDSLLFFTAILGNWIHGNACSIYGDIDSTNAPFDIVSLQ